MPLSEWSHVLRWWKVSSLFSWHPMSGVGTPPPSASQPQRGCNSSPACWVVLLIAGTCSRCSEKVLPIHPLPPAHLQSIWLPCWVLKGMCQHMPRQAEWSWGCSPHSGGTYLAKSCPQDRQHPPTNAEYSAERLQLLFKAGEIRLCRA